MNLLAIMMVMTLVISGLGVALLGSVKVALAARLAIDEARVGGLVSLFGFMLMPVVLAAGFLTDQVGRQTVLVGGGAIFAISLALLARARSYPAALVGVLLLSTGWAFLVNVGNVLVPLAFPGNTPDDTTYSTNLANVFFGLGAFLTPMATAIFLRRASLTMFLLTLAGLALLPAVLAACLGPQEFVQPVVESNIARVELPFSQLLGDPVVWLLGFGLFFYGPLEACLAAWTTTFLSERGLSERTAAFMLSVFWLTFMAARLVTAFTLAAGSELVYLFILALCTAAVLTLGVVSKEPGAALAMVTGAGVFLGPIFPTLMALLLKLPESLHGRAVGMFFAIGGLGWTLIPIFIGTYAKRTSLTRAFGIAVVTALGLAAVVMSLWLVRV